MGGALSVRRLGPGDALALVALRREALEREPLAFAASVEDDRGLSVDFVRAGLADDHHLVLDLRAVKLPAGCDRAR